MNREPEMKGSDVEESRSRRRGSDICMRLSARQPDVSCCPRGRRRLFHSSLRAMDPVTDINFDVLIQDESLSLEGLLTDVDFGQLNG